MKKRILSILLTAVLICTIFPIFTYAASLGDIDKDGKITTTDARLALRAAVGLESFNDEQKSLADVDRDNKITTTDARKILRAAVGLENLSSGGNNTSSNVDYAYLAASDFRTIRRTYPDAVALRGYVIVYTDQDNNEYALTYITYKIISSYNETTLHNLTTGQTIHDPYNYYNSLAERAYGAARLNYLAEARDILEMQGLALKALQSVITTGVNPGPGIYLDASYLNA